MRHNCIFFLFLIMAMNFTFSQELLAVSPEAACLARMYECGEITSINELSQLKCTPRKHCFSDSDKDVFYHQNLCIKSTTANDSSSSHVGFSGETGGLGAKCSSVEQIKNIIMEDLSLDGFRLVPQANFGYVDEELDFYVDKPHIFGPNVTGISIMSGIKNFASNDYEKCLNGILPDLAQFNNLLEFSLFNNTEYISTPPFTRPLNGPCTLDGDIASFSKLNQLRFILIDNALSGNLNSLINLTQLRNIYISNTKIIGSLPNLDNFNNLLDLRIIGNKGLVGTIPNLDKLSNIVILILSENKHLTGNIPDLKKLSNLRELILSDNNLTGNIPDITKLKKLALLDVSNNQLTGSIPSLKNIAYYPRDKKVFIAIEDQVKLCGNRLCRDEKIDQKGGYAKFSADALAYPLCNSKEYEAGDYASCLQFLDPVCSELTNPESMSSELSGLTDSEVLELANELSNSESTTKCNGEYVRFANGHSIVSPDDIEKIHVSRVGIVADGVTRLLLKMPSDAPVTFHLNPTGKDSKNCKWGTLMKTDGTAASCSSVSVSPVKTLAGNYVFAVYQAPDQFPTDSKSGEAVLRIESISLGESRKGVKLLKLYPPSVVLVHGVWDKLGTWEGGLFGKGSTKLFLEKAGFKNIYLVDHKKGKYPAVGSFDPNDNSSVAIPELIAKTKEALTDLRSKGIAASQVDVIGHSMGGLIIRATAKTTHYDYKYQRLDNYNKGDFHKIITISTPHHGSRLADILINGKDRVRNTGGDCINKLISKRLEMFFEKSEETVSAIRTDGIEASLNKLIVCDNNNPERCYLPLELELKHSNLRDENANEFCNGSETLEKLLARNDIRVLGFSLPQHPLGPAIYGFQTGSTALKNLGGTHVPSHAIVGVAPTGNKLELLDGKLELDSKLESISVLEVALNGLLKLYGLKAIGNNPKQIEDLRYIDEILGGNANHDTIVSVESQQGGLSGNATKKFSNVDHLGVTGSFGGQVVDDIQEWLVFLLNQSPSSEYFQFFPAPMLENKSNLPFKEK